MTWIETLKVGDKVGVKVNQLGNQNDTYLIGVISKVTKVKIEVDLIRYTSTFNRNTGSAKRSSQWNIPDQLVELTPEVLELVAHRRLASALEKRLSCIRVKEFTLEQMQRLNSFLDSLKD
jgi:hypothetical protein